MTPSTDHTVLTAMLLYNITVETGQFAVIRRSIGALSGDGRVQAVLLRDAEIKALEVSPAEAERLRGTLAKVQPKFTEMAGKMQNAGKVTWLHLESSQPQTRPADAVGSKYDLIRQPRGTVVYEAAGKSDWMHIGELVKVGEAWRLIDGPTHGASAIDQAPPPSGGTPVANTPAMQKSYSPVVTIQTLFISRTSVEPTWWPAKPGRPAGTPQPSTEAAMPYAAARGTWSCRCGSTSLWCRRRNV